jgi:hypothetical protein
VAARQLVCPVGGDQQERQVGRLAADEAQEVEGGRIAPVEVIEEEDERAGSGERCEVVAHGGEERALALQLHHGCAGRADGGSRKCVAARGAGECLGPGAVGRRL